jgi:hypothetical protein
MADISILAALDSIEDMDSSISETVAQRGFLSLASIFDESGITQEHSISYQEHNYPVALKFLHASAKLISTDEQTTAKNLSKGSSELLSFFTRANGEYFPVGDSFRLPNLNIRKLHPEIDAPFVSVDGPDFSPKIFNKNGFFAYINNIEGRRLHFTSCCAWHSANHKQDDDLSFCLELDGELVFDDAGYSDQASRSVNDALRSAGHHSTVELPGHPYTARNKTNHKSKLSESLLTTSGFKLSGSHQRIPGVTVTREFTLTEKTLTITDILTTDINTISEHGFVLAHDIEVRIKNSNIMLYRGFKLIGSLESANNEGDWLISRINHVRSNRSDIAHTTRLAFRSFNNKENTFIFVFY